MRKSDALIRILEAMLVAPDAPQYGFELSQITQTLPGTLYPLLKRLEEAQWLSAESEERKPGVLPNRPLRRYYRFTKLGKEQAMNLVGRHNATKNSIAPGVRRFTDALPQNSAGLLSSMALKIGGSVRRETFEVCEDLFHAIPANQRMAEASDRGNWFLYDADPVGVIQWLDFLLAGEVAFNFDAWDDGYGWKYRHRREIGLEKHYGWGATCDEVVYPQWDIDRLRDAIVGDDRDRALDYLERITRWKRHRLAPLEITT
jgi:DNA-binding PadR family transcriptional regulator